MGKMVTVDADGKVVPDGSVTGAWRFEEGDDRLDKFRASVKARAAVAAGKPIPSAAAAEEDATVERVERPRGTK